MGYAKTRDKTRAHATRRLDDALAGAGNSWYITGWETQKAMFEDLWPKPEFEALKEATDAGEIIGLKAKATFVMHVRAAAGRRYAGARGARGSVDYRRYETVSHRQTLAILKQYDTVLEEQTKKVG